MADDNGITTLPRVEIEALYGMLSGGGTVPTQRAIQVYQLKSRKSSRNNGTYRNRTLSQDADGYWDEYTLERPTMQ
jgi:hypothetical protein